MKRWKLIGIRINRMINLDSTTTKIYWTMINH